MPSDDAWADTCIPPARGGRGLNRFRRALLLLRHTVGSLRFRPSPCSEDGRACTSGRTVVKVANRLMVSTVRTSYRTALQATPLSRCCKARRWIRNGSNTYIRTLRTEVRNVAWTFMTSTSILPVPMGGQYPPPPAPSVRPEHPLLRRGCLSPVRYYHRSNTFCR